MRVRRSTTPLFGLVTLALLAALAAGCAADTDPEGRVDRWLDQVCDGNRPEGSFEPGEEEVAEAGGRAFARAACTLDDDASTQVEAYVFERDPGDELLRVMDGYESGHGIHVTYATTKLEDDRWGAVFAFTEDDHLLDALEEEPEQEERWRIQATWNGDG